MSVRGKTRMKKEEAIARIKDHKIVHKMNEPRAIYISEALDMAIKALEQESKIEEVLKKIRAEIIECSVIDDDEEYIDNGGLIIELKTVLEIIERAIKEVSE